MNVAARFAAGGVAIAVGTGFAQMLPAVSALRRVRNLVMPSLAGVGDSGHVALTFDDGPSPVSTPAFLDALDSLGWKATFFMLGEMVAGAPEVALEVAQRGHEVAVHGFKHENHLRKGPRWSTRDLLAARDLIGELTGSRLRWFRPPYGALAGSSVVAAKRCGLQPVLWTTWGRDWEKTTTPATVVQEVTASMVRGPTVLLHDSDHSSAEGSWKATLAALPLLADLWARQGLKVGPLLEHWGAEAAGGPGFNCA
jgi:peptidoglycan/xylan/chitin deacetylase (PgdA/CDA1 family)